MSRKILESKMFPCQYLVGSTECLLHGISNYNNPEAGYIDRSFAEIQRAWNALWIADVKSIQPDFNFQIRNKDKTYGIEDFADKSIPSLKEIDRLERNFQAIEGKPGNLQNSVKANYILVYKLRNITQHDFVEMSRGLHGEMTSILNPYMLANFLNFIETYNGVYGKVLLSCKSHTVQRRNGHCVKQKIINPVLLKNMISLPMSLDILDFKNSLEFVDLAHMSNVRISKSQKSTLRAHLYKEIANAERGLSRTEKAERSWKYDLSTTVTEPFNKITLTAKIASAMDTLEADFCYESLAEIARERLGFQNKKLSDSEKESLQKEQKRIQNIKEGIERRRIKKEDETNRKEPYVDETYWRTFWGRTRYNKKFAQEVNRVLDIKDETL